MLDILYLALGLVSFCLAVMVLIQAGGVYFADDSVRARNRRAAILAKKNNKGCEMSKDENKEVDEFCKMGVLETNPVYKIIKGVAIFSRHLKITRQALRGEV